MAQHEFASQAPPRQHSPRQSDEINRVCKMAFGVVPETLAKSSGHSTRQRAQMGGLLSSLKVRRWLAEYGRRLAEGEPMRKAKEVLPIVFEAVTVVGALLLVPCVLADLAFGCTLTEPLAQVVLAAAVSTILLTALALHEGWYVDHLTNDGGGRAST